MRSKGIFGVLFVGLLGIGIGMARASTLLDTGPGPDSPIGFGVSGPNSPYGPLGVESLAGEFTTSQAWTISSVEGWIAAYPADFPPGPVDLNVSIYSDAPAGPAVYEGTGQPGSAMFNSSFRLNLCPGAQPTCPVGWQGATDLSWKLSPGTYWVVFEGTGSDTGWAEMPGGVSAPLENYLFLAAGNQGLWGELSPPGIGMEISGTTSAPEPATLWLLLGGIGIALAFRRRRALSV